jgi:ElaB/YqjD/DUF883 family membrane-anchored ribosome-binding protein
MEVKMGSEGNIAQASSSAHETIDRMSAAARPGVDRVASTAHRAVDRMAGMASQAADTLSVQGQKLKDAQGRVMANSRTYVRDHPIASIGIAVAAGFLISRIFGSRD